MNIIRKPSSNYYTNRNGVKPIGICNHISVGTMTSMDAWFKNPASNASAHFGIGRNGAIHQYVDIEHGAWTQGITRDAIKYATAPLIKSMDMNPNLYLIGIEHEGYAGNGVDGDLTEAQLKSSLWLHKYIQDYVMKKWKHKIDLNSYYVLGHYQIDPRRKPFCPGKKFPWSRLYAELAIADTMTLEEYEEHLYYTSKPAYNRALCYAFAERVQELSKTLTDKKWGKEARRKLLKLSPIMEELNYSHYEGDTITAEGIVKRILDVYKNSHNDKFEGEAFRKLNIGATYAKQVSIL